MVETPEGLRNCLNAGGQYCCARVGAPASSKYLHGIERDSDRKTEELNLPDVCRRCRGPWKLLDSYCQGSYPLILHLLLLSFLSRVNYY